MDARNVHLFHARRGHEIGGFWQHGGVSVATFHLWLHECYIFTPGDWELVPTQLAPPPLTASGPALVSTDLGILQPGNYTILERGTGRPFTIGDNYEKPRRRAYSVSYTYTPHSENFTTRVRARDLRCCLTGEEVPVGLRSEYDFVRFEAAHIYPLSETDDFFRLGFDQYITDPQATTSDRVMNSVQQGFLAESGWHKAYDDYQVGVNPSDGYRITGFLRRGGAVPQPSPVDGRVFYRNPVAPSDQQPSDELLADHYRRCVLANMKKAAAEPLPVFDPEVHLGPGGFDLGRSDFWRSSEGHEQFATEMRARLAAVGYQRTLQERDRMASLTTGRY